MKTKILKKITVFILILFVLSFNITYATNNTYNIKFKRNTPVLIHSNYSLVNPYYSYEGETNGVAYCMDPKKNGATERDKTYYVVPRNKITDEEIWRVFANGYPCKTIEELNCNTKEEAYEATWEAIHCVTGYFNASNYKPITDSIEIKESGQRVINAMNQILTNAELSTEMPPSDELIINEKNWKVYEQDSTYKYKEIKVENPVMQGTYKVSLDGNIPEGTLILDSTNSENNVFNNGEAFKILISTDKIKQAGEFTLNISANLKTLAVYDAYPIEEGRQNYALIVPIEKIVKSFRIQYEGPKGNLKIIKSDYETKNKLAKAIFNILNSNKEVVYSNLETNENGLIELENINAGIYYIEEVKAPNGYQKLKEAVEFELKNNQDLSINVANRKIVQTNINKNTGTININTNYEENTNTIQDYRENINITDKTNTNNRIAEANDLNKRTEKNNVTKTEKVNILNEYNIISKNNNSTEETNTNIKSNETTVDNNISKDNTTINEIKENTKTSNINIKNNTTKKTDEIEKTNLEQRTNQHEARIFSNVENPLKEKQRSIVEDSFSFIGMLPVTGM